MLFSYAFISTNFKEILHRLLTPAIVPALYHFWLLHLLTAPITITTKIIILYYIKMIFGGYPQ